MTQRIDLFDSTYGNFTARVLDDIRKDTYGVDIGQNSLTTADEYDRYIAMFIFIPPLVTERFEGLQRFFAAVHRLTSERRLSRFAYLVEKP